MNVDRRLHLDEGACAGSAARVFATNVAMKHTVEMVQILGGYGISKEYTLEKYMRDAKLLQIMDATNEIMTIKGAALL